MLVKITPKNCVTIPKKIMDQLPGAKFFDVELQDGVITLKPMIDSEKSLKKIRSKMKKLGLSQDSVAAAIHYARNE